MDSCETHSNTNSSPDSNLERDRDAASLPIAARRRQADEWALVLTAEGFSPEVVRCPDGFRIEVAPEARAEASLILEAWQAERAARAQRAPLPLPPTASAIEIATACALALSLLVFHLGLEAAGRRGSFIEIGASQAELVLGGQFWRLATALTLHSDFAHVLGNTLFGGFFLATLVGRLGVGLSALAFVVTGILGNLANALYYGSDHGSIGASTGVFGLVGVLTGLLHGGAIAVRHPVGVAGWPWRLASASWRCSDPAARGSTSRHISSDSLRARSRACCWPHPWRAVLHRSAAASCSPSPAPGR